MIHALIATALLTAAAPAPKATAPSPNEIVAAAPAADWTHIPASDLLIMTLIPNAAGKVRRVVIQLMPPPFSQGWIGNIRRLAAAHWWDGTSINRVQDNYVVQWGDPSEKKPLPSGLVKVPESEYTSPVKKDRLTRLADQANLRRLGAEAATSSRDSYAPLTIILNGWPIAASASGMWPVHCYGMVGVGRNLPPDTGTGAELYTVIGTPPRHLDRNIALVGRVIEGMEHLSSLPRGTGDLGFYTDTARRVPIASVRLASELPASNQPHFEYLSTDSASFARYTEARTNRRDAFFIRPAGGADICNIPIPIRRARAASTERHAASATSQAATDLPSPLPVLLPG